MKKEREYCIYIFKKETPVYGNGRWPQKKVGPEFLKKILKNFEKVKSFFEEFVMTAKDTYVLA